MLYPGGYLVSDSGANAVLLVTDAGEVTPFAIFPPRENTTGVGPPVFQQVPTGIELGSDGSVYVATLTGFPFPQGEAIVYRLEDLDGNGDALGEGETVAFATGFSTATDVHVEDNGDLYVTEFSTDMNAQAPGRLVRWRDGEITVIAEGLISPTSVIVIGEPPGSPIAGLRHVLVTQEFAGLVTSFVDPEVAAPIVEQAGVVLGQDLPEGDWKAPDDDDDDADFSLAELESCQPILPLALVPSDHPEADLRTSASDDWQTPELDLESEVAIFRSAADAEAWFAASRDALIPAAIFQCLEEAFTLVAVSADAELDGLAVSVRPGPVSDSLAFDVELSIDFGEESLPLTANFVRVWRGAAIFSLSLSDVLGVSQAATADALARTVADRLATAQGLAPTVRELPTSGSGGLADTDNGAPAWTWALLAAGLAGAVAGTTVAAAGRRRR